MFKNIASMYNRIRSICVVVPIHLGVAFLYRN